MSIPIPRRLRFDVFKRDAFACQYCGCKASEKALEVDHVVPRSKGGGHDMANLVTSCIACNKGKGDVALDDAPTVEIEWGLVNMSDLNLPEF